MAGLMGRGRAAAKSEGLIGTDMAPVFPRFLLSSAVSAGGERDRHFFLRQNVVEMQLCSTWSP